MRQEIEITLGIRSGRALRHIRPHHGPGVAEPPGRRASEPSSWAHPVLATVASQGEGIEQLIAALDDHRSYLSASGELDRRRRQRLYDRTREVVERATRQWVWQETAADQMIRDRLDEVAAGRLSPYEVAGEVLDGLRQGSRV
jgi:LAO/AO transport system kinase